MAPSELLGCRGWMRFRTPAGGHCNVHVLKNSTCWGRILLQTGDCLATVLETEEQFLLLLWGFLLAT